MAAAIEIHDDVPMRTRDGVRLRADIYRPAGTGRVPAILLRTPYGKASDRLATSMVTGIRPEVAARHGFAFVIQDVRGCGGSEGHFDPLGPLEGPDGCDTVEWLAEQPWCTGRVGMVGASYSGYLQLVAAATRPPSLAAIVPDRTPPDSTAAAAFLDSTVIAWVAGQAAAALRRARARPGGPSELRSAGAPAGLEAVLDLLDRPRRQAWHLPLDEAPFVRWSGFRTYADLVAHLRGAAMPLDPAAIAVPAFFITGWYDLAPAGVVDVYTAVRRSGGTGAARRGSRLLIGPWDHHLPRAWLGERFFGNRADPGGIDLPGRQLRFLSRWLRDDDVDTAPVTYFLTGADTWRESDAWPPPDTPDTPLYLCPGEALSWQEPPAAPPRRYRYDPHHPVPAFGGRYYALGGSIPGPFSQARIEQRADVVCCTGSPLPSLVEVIGRVVLRLSVSSNVTETDFFAKLCDVDPEGVSLNIADGFVRVALPGGGQPVSADVDLGVVAHAFRPGHRIRIQLSSSAFPAVERIMNTGNRPGSDTAGCIAVQEVHLGGRHATHLLLPVPRR